MAEFREERLYKTVEDYLKLKQNCFYTAHRIGNLKYGYMDVAGFKHLNKEQNAIEIIGVEVKDWKSKICSGFGQAKGYSIFCHRIYFAVGNWMEQKIAYTQEEKEIAEFLSIGLLQINRTNGEGLEVIEILPAPRNKPIEKLVETLLTKTKKPQV